MASKSNTIPSLPEPEGLSPVLPIQAEEGPTGLVEVVIKKDNHKHRGVQKKAGDKILVSPTIENFLKKAGVI